MDRHDFKEILKQRGASKGGANKPRVLVVDDDKGVREALRFELETRYEVDLVSSAAEGIAAVAARPMVVLLDIKMKGEDGFHAYREIRKIDQVVPIIFHSAYQDVKDPYEIMNQYKPFAYLTKGGDLRELHRQIEMAVEHYRKHVLMKAELNDKLKKMSEEVDRLRAMMKK
jgi:DNA-binding NtrC family response regulator